MLLRELIREAGMFGSAACDAGRHEFDVEGGRACPDGIDANCSQPVFRCRHCGGYDYGERGGPGWQHCREDCESRHLWAVRTTTGGSDGQ